MAQQLNQNFGVEIQSNRIEGTFEKAVIDAVDECFSSIEYIDKHVLYKYLEEKFSIKKKEIPFKIEEFTDAVERIFGEAAKLIEIRIIQNLHSKIQDFDYQPKNKNLVFTEYLTTLRTAFNNY